MDCMDWKIPIPPAQKEAGPLPAIRENNEPLVSLMQYAPQLAVYPVCYHEGFAHAPADCLVRSAVADRLLQAAKLLPASLRPVVLDGYRSLQVQRGRPGPEAPGHVRRRVARFFFHAKQKQALSRPPPKGSRDRAG
ncbi:hypothetical protein [Brevibacillus sp. SAFN-007a]|uniref:hypothetical protein n=1 Tax=Brevibacillus sp. SAFN-007a TaxID=3436862 RepID=UPI003F7CF3F2